MRKYGLPCQGSKNKFAKQIISILPPANTLIEPFVGGGAITDAAIESGRWANFIINDKRPGLAKAVAEIFERGPRGVERWISRDEYMTRRFDDPMIGLLWSFGGNGRSYFCDARKERLKKLAFTLVTSGNYEERYTAYRKFMLALQEEGGDLKSMEYLEPLNRAKNLETMKKDKPVSVKAFEGDYQALELPESDAVIYCDPPYQRTDGYRETGKFDYERFYEWCGRQTLPVFISEYEMPADRFVCINERATNCTMDARATRMKVERLFVPKHQAASVHSLVLR